MDEYGQAGQSQPAVHSDGPYGDTSAHADLLASLRVDRPRSAPPATWPGLLDDTVEQPAVAVIAPEGPDEIELPCPHSVKTAPTAPGRDPDSAPVPRPARDSTPEWATGSARVPMPKHPGDGGLDAGAHVPEPADAQAAPDEPAQVTPLDGPLPDEPVWSGTTLSTLAGDGTAAGDDALTGQALIDDALIGQALIQDGLAGGAFADRALADRASAESALAEDALAEDALARDALADGGGGGGGGGGDGAAAGDGAVDEELAATARRVGRQIEVETPEDAASGYVNGYAQRSSSAPPAVPMTFRTADDATLVAVAEDQGHLADPGDPPLPLRREPLRSARGTSAVGGDTPAPPGLVPLLPHRVPAPPDVPEVPDELDDVEEPEAAADRGELSRIATRLRDDEPPAEPPADLDVSAVLEAVRKVPGVANAQLRGVPGGMHTLRLDLADGADAGRVSRLVARLLKERMGLAAEPRRPRPGEPTRESTLSAPPPRPSTLADVTSAPVTTVPGPRSAEPGSRVVVDQVRVSTLGTEATVEVRLIADGRPSVGAATGPAVDGYLLRLAASAAASAIDGLIESSPRHQMVRCFIDHAGVVPFGSVNVAVVVLLISGSGWVEQLVGSALVGGDPRQAIVRATLAAVNRRLETLLG